MIVEGVDLPAVVRAEPNGDHRLRPSSELREIDGGVEAAEDAASAQVAQVHGREALVRLRKESASEVPGFDIPGPRLYCDSNARPGPVLNVLGVLDGSRMSADVAWEAARIATRHNARLTLIHTLEPTPWWALTGLSFGIPVTPSVLLEDRFKHAHRRLRDIAGALDYGPGLTLRCRKRSVSVLVHNEAVSGTHDVLVCGRRAYRRPLMFFTRIRSRSRALLVVVDCRSSRDAERPLIPYSTTS